MAASQDLQYFQAAGEMNARNQQLELQRMQQLAQDDYHAQQIRLEEERRAEIKKQKEKEAYDLWQQQQLMRNAISSVKEDELIGTGVQADEAIAAKMRQAGINALKNGQATAGLELIQKANAMQKDVASVREAEMRVSAVKKEQIGDILSSASPENWEATKVSLSKLGYVVPQQYNQFNADTKTWIQNQSLMSKKVRDAEAIELKQQKLLADIKSKEAAMELAREKEQRIKDKEAYNREMVDLKYKTGKGPAGDKEVKLLMKELGADDLIDDLDKEQQINIAKDFDYVVRDVMLKNPELSFDQARAEAKDIIKSRISGDEYSPKNTKAAPPVGTIKGGYKFKGGNPADKNNWEKI